MDRRSSKPTPMTSEPARRRCSARSPPKSSGFPSNRCPFAGAIRRFRCADRSTARVRPWAPEARSRLPAARSGPSSRRSAREESLREPTYGRWLAKNLSNVAIPVNADIPTDITIHFVSEFDEHASAIGVRGIGELAATGVDAAVAAAVYDAVGVRVRELP